MICPTCEKVIEYDKTSEYRPFCSERCRLIDLGDWAQEKFSIPLHHEQGFDSPSLSEISDETENSEE